MKQIVVEPSGRAVLDGRSAMDMAELRSSAVLEAVGANRLARRENFADGKINLTRYKPDLISLSVTVGGDAFLVIANTWNPYWTDTVDGKSQSLIRTNHAQYGLPPAADSHTIVLAYRPPYAF